MAAGLPRAAARAVALAAALGAAACTTVPPRNAAPEALAGVAAPYGIQGPPGVLREWGDVLDPETNEAIVAARVATMRRIHGDAIARGEPIEETALLLSGGGPDGAFGAGLLAGWSARGDRPEFTVVTGVSTGAIIALFAYLGPDYDDELREIYTTYRTEDLLQRALFTALTGGSAITDTRGYRALIERYVDDEVVRKLAEQAERGRVLLIGTTNLDAARPVVWNVSGIAHSGQPSAKRLIHDVIQASSAIPAAFPPVLVPVVAENGRRYDEMHVDGGATQQVIYFSPTFSLRRVDAALGVAVERDIYAVINNKLRKPYSPVRPRVGAIAAAAASSLIGGSGGGDLYRVLAIALRDGYDLNVVGIPPDFDAQPTEPFDPVYMTALYELGYDYGLAGDRWLPHPPDFDPKAGGASGARVARR